MNETETLVNHLLRLNERMQTLIEAVTEVSRALDHTQAVLTQSQSQSQPQTNPSRVPSSKELETAVERSLPRVGGPHAKVE